MNIVTTAVVNNEWYMVYNTITRKLVNSPTFVDENTSATIGITSGIKVEVANTEQELLDKISELNLIIEETINT